MNDNTEQIQGMLKAQNEMLRHQQESFKQIIAQQKELLANQQRDLSQRKMVFRGSCAILIAYMLFSAVQLYLI